MEDTTLEGVFQQLGRKYQQIVVIGRDGRVIGGVNKDDIVMSLLANPTV